MSVLYHNQASARQVYNIVEVSEMLGMSQNSVRKAIRQNLIPHKRINGRIVIPVRAFNEWMDEVPGEVMIDE